MAFNQYINMLVWPMLACGDSVNMFSQGAASIRRIQEIFKEQPEIADTDKTKEVDEINGEMWTTLGAKLIFITLPSSTAVTANRL